MNALFYRLLLIISRPFIAFFARNHQDKYPEPSHPERLGLYSPYTPVAEDDNDFGTLSQPFRFTNPIWIQAKSLSETRAVLALIRLLLDQDYPILLTHETATGRALATKQFSEAIGEGRLVQVWQPYDYPDSVQGFLRHWQPRCGLFIERPGRPHLVFEAKRLGIPLLLLSASMTDERFKRLKFWGGVWVQRYRLLDRILVQSQEDIERFDALNIPTSAVVGNLKFDVNIAMAQVQLANTLKSEWQRPVVLIGNTREGEEQDFIRHITHTVKHQANPPLFIVVPRHTQRFAHVQALLEQSGLRFVRRSDVPDPQALVQAHVFFGDTLGEMCFYSALADVAIVAGSFGDFGGHNHMEAIALGVPVIVGPHTSNFEKSVQDAIIEGAARRTQTPLQAIELALQLLDQPQALRRMGQAGQQWLALHQGVSQRLLPWIQPYAEDAPTASIPS